MRASSQPSQARAHIQTPMRIRNISLLLEVKVHVLVSVSGVRGINVPQIYNELPADARPCNFESQVIFLFANARKLFNKSIYVITTHTYTELRAMIYAHSKCWKFVLK